MKVNSIHSFIKISRSSNLIWFLGLLFTLNLGGAQLSYATHEHATSYYFTTIHFTDEAYGKKVKSVMAHMGINTMSGDWIDVQDIQLEHQQDHFFGKILLVGQDHATQHEFEFPVVQYWVICEDGSRQITPVYTVSLSKDLGSYNTMGSCEGYFRIAKEKENFSHIQDSLMTSFTKIRLSAAD